MTTTPPELVNDTIWRIKLTDQLTLAELPPGATFLSALPGNDRAGNGCLNSYWLVTPTTAEPEQRYISLIRTGEPLPIGAKFLATLATGLHLVEIPAAFATA